MKTAQEANEAARISYYKVGVNIINERLADWYCDIERIIDQESSEGKFKCNVGEIPKGVLFYDAAAFLRAKLEPLGYRVHVMDALKKFTIDWTLR
ncbi:MAG: hypothetical protein F6K48_03395 [Okeania sp. SIO3H1]|nr:hypothetical protein [Okeania sp. SIO3H1]